MQVINIKRNPSYYIYPAARIFVLTAFLFLILSFSASASTTNMHSTIYSRQGILYDLRNRSSLSQTKFKLLQGGVSDGTYAYYTFNKKGNRGSQIVKVRIRDIRKRPKKAYQKKSKAYHMGHANDIAYNPRTRCLYVIHNVDLHGKPSRMISVFSSSTLNRKKRVTVKIPSNLPGATKKLRRRIKGFAGIAYNDSRGQFVLLISGEERNFLILNSQLEAIQYVCTKKRTSYINQGIDCSGDTIRVLRSKAKNGSFKNVINEYSWDGKHRRTIRILGMHYEGENIFHHGSTIYVTCTAHSNLLQPSREAFISELGNKTTVRKVRLNRRKLRLKRGQSVRLRARTGPRKAKNKRALFLSLNRRVATVSYRGVVRARRPGKAIIVAYSKDGYYTDYCRVTVKE